ncbi:MAG TPA: 4Fe-4S dicluster domain-containing protein [Gemmata sp.]
MSGRSDGGAVHPNPRDAAEVLDRRRFLALTGASAALAGGAGCSPRPAPPGEIVPYVRPPEQLTPGVPLHFATAMELAGTALGLLVTSHEGRPTKIEGNPEHPGSLGSSDRFSQAALLGLYDPDRSRQVTHRNRPATWEDALPALRAALGAQHPKGGSGVRVLTGATSSPSFADAMAALLARLPGAKWVRYEPCGRGAADEGTRRAFGEVLRPVYDFTRADVVLALGADFLSCEPGTVRYQRDFATRRHARGGTAGQMNRLYAVESALTATGAHADHRLALKPSALEGFARALAAELKVPGAPPAEARSGAARAWLAPLARDLLAHRGRGLVLVGAHLPPALHALGHALNHALGNVGSTVRLTAPPAGATAGAGDLTDLVRDMNAGAVEVLLVLGSNPVYSAPADLAFARALHKVPTTAHLGAHPDETAARCVWHLPESHPLECWGDALGFDGTATVQQPLIEPLYDTRSALELVAALTGGWRRGRDLVREHWRRARGAPADFDSFWERTVQAGFVSESAAAAKEVKLAADWWPENAPAAEDGTLEVEFCPDPALFDGRFANNAWLQELPQPVTKLTWGNAALMSPATAAALGVRQEVVGTGGQHGGAETDVVELKYRGRGVRAPVLVVAGHADGAVTLHLGHGRTRAGRVGTGVGFDAYQLRTSDAPGGGRGLEVVRTGGRERLACTQAHHAMNYHEPVRHTTAAEFARRPNFIPPKLETEAEKAAVTAISLSEPPPAAERDRRLVPLSLYPEWPYPNRKWGMAIDLSACTGCSACVVACQAENNIPVVGKEQVLRAREMHWIRVDRYFTDAGTFFQPVPCMQCENAPCEYVCPTGATVHSHDGLNDMVYNRCVGTRYCSNNCPYKVRRFNFLAFQDWDTDTLKLGRNPEVTVRSRGVMEKCTYCVQRIRGAEIASERTGAPIPDGSLQTACQQACPSRAIRFGDLNDPGAEVRQWKAQPHDYALLADLNTRPRTTYLAAVRNPNPDMPQGT